MSRLVPQRVNQRNTSNVHLCAEPFIVAKTKGVATFLITGCVSLFGAPIRHVSMVLAEGVTGLWADVKDLVMIC